jgi:hypothetical protein
MPKVPTYDAPTVETRALPNARQQSIASPELFAADAEEQINLGKGMLYAGNKLTELQLEKQAAKNLATVESAYAELADFDLTARTVYTRDVLGKQAEGLMDTHATEYDKRTAKIAAEKLENDEQKKAFAKMTARLRNSSLNEVAAHEIRETKVFNQQAAEAVLNTTIKTGAAAVLPQMVDEQLQLGKDALKASLYTQGITPGSEQGKAIYDSKMMNYTSTFHATRINELLATGDQGKMKMAEEHFKKYGAEINPAQHAKIAEAFTQLNTERATQDFVDDLMKAGGLTRESGLAAIQEKFTEPQRRKAAAQDFKTRWADREHDEEQRIKKLRDPIHTILSDALQKKKLIKLTDPQVKGALSVLRTAHPESEHWASSQIASFNEHLIQQGRVASGKVSGEKAEIEYAQNFGSLLAQYNSNPAAFAKVDLLNDKRWWGLTESDRQEMQRLQKPTESPSLGTMTKLLNTYKGFFKKEYQAGGIEKFDLFTRVVWERVREAEAVSGAKVLRHEEIQKIIDSSLLVTKDRWWGKDERAFENPAAPVKHPRATTLKDVPRDVQAKIVEMARQNGVVATPEVIIRKSNELNGYK